MILTVVNLILFTIASMTEAVFWIFAEDSADNSRSTRDS